MCGSMAQPSSLRYSIGMLSEKSWVRITQKIILYYMSTLCYNLGLVYVILSVINFVISKISKETRILRCIIGGDFTRLKSTFEL